MILDDDLHIDALTTADWQRVHDLVVQYADPRLGGTDASLIGLAERHNEQLVATLNRRHFSVVRPAHTDAFTLLPDTLRRATATTLRRTVFTVPGRLVTSARRRRLRLPAGWPWADQFTTAVDAITAIPTRC